MSTNYVGKNSITRFLEKLYETFSKKGHAHSKMDILDFPTIPTKVSDLTNDRGYLTSFTETDPTVPAWAKAATKPTYTASEVGALPANTVIPDSLADLNDDTTHRTVTDAEKNTWNAKANVSDIPAVPTKISAFENDKGYLTEHQSLEGLATQEYVDEGLTTKQPIGDYALKSDIPDASAAIIDVTELPTENINEGAFYRLATAKFVSTYYSSIDGWTCHYVNELPSVGEPASTDMVNITAYYNAQDGEVYGYADEMISAAGGIPVGWYPIGVLGQAFNVTWGGVITDAEQVDDSTKVLLSKDYYIYQDGWCKIPFAYEKAPEFDIQWDGVIGDRFTLDLSAMGFDGTYYVKVSDKVFTTEQLVGATYVQSDGSEHIVAESDIDTTLYAGVLSFGGIIIAYSAEDTNAALGLPSGYLTNGTYFIYVVDSHYISRLVTPSKIIKIDEKYLPDIGVGKNVTGQEFEVDGEIVVASGGSEVFNDYVNNKATGYYSHAEGHHSHASGDSSHAEGESTHAEGRHSHAEGSSSHAEGTSSHAEGIWSHASGDSSHAEGLSSHAEGSYSHAEGEYTHAAGQGSHAEGYKSHAEGNYSHAEGYYSHAKGNYSHAEGEQTQAVGRNSHAEGYYSHAEELGSHAEGRESHAAGQSSHAEGFRTHAEGNNSHAEGFYSHAEGNNSHAEGYYSHAAGGSQHVQGEYNLIDPEYNVDTPGARAKYAHIVGNGTSDIARSNAHTLDWNGNAWFAGNIYIGGTGQDDTNAIKVAIVPFPTESDEGKFLRVVNGAPTWVSIPNAEEATF